MKFLLVHNQSVVLNKMASQLSIDGNVCDKAIDWLSCVQQCNSSLYDAILLPTSLEEFPPELLSFFLQNVIGDDRTSHHVLLFGNPMGSLTSDDLKHFGVSGCLPSHEDNGDMLSAIRLLLQKPSEKVKKEGVLFETIKRSAVSLHQALRSKSAYKKNSDSSIETERELVLALDFLRQRFVEQTEASMISLLAAAEARDPFLRGHLKWAARIAYEIAKILELDRKELQLILRGTLLHDIGKIGIPDRILTKKTRLTESERNMIKGHPVIGARILERNPIFKPYLDIVSYHHERLDGTGYPYGKKGSEIPFHAQIVAVADVFSALTTARPYRTAVKPFEALDEIKKTHLQLNPDCIAALEKYVEKYGGVLSPSVFSHADSNFFKF